MAATDAAWAQEARERIQLLDDRLAQQYDRGVAATELTRERALGIDGIVREAWSACIPEDEGATLFAVGGYGRMSMYPQSDVDLLILADAQAQRRLADPVARFIAMLWDARVAASHSVRSLEDVETSAHADITVMTALMDARLLAGKSGDASALQTAIATERVWPPAEYFASKREELRQRHARFEAAAANLEPNIKEGPGGLRDLQTLRWMAMRVLSAAGLEHLESLGQLGQDERETLVRAAATLQRLRYGLHLVSGKREERLRFDHQRTLAARLNKVETAENAMVEAMMQEYYRSAALVQRVGERLLQRFEEQLEGEAETQMLDAEFGVQRGYLVARSEGWPHADASAVFSLFQAWGRHPELRGLHSRTARSLAEALPSVPAYVDATPELRAQFLRLLSVPSAVATLERMAYLGVLARWIPAFALVTGRMQFDLFHTYTVDQHTLALLRNFALFESGDDSERFSIAHTVWPLLRKPKLLLLAGLFHDIGKGRGGDHSLLGAVDAREFCAAHELPEAETELVAWCVEKHLAMSVTAQKQDIGDPEVIQRFAQLVSDRERLDHLYLLTCADIAATSPKLWNAWKDRLLADLYVATRLALRRGLEAPVAAESRIAQSRAQVEEMLLDSGSGCSGMNWIPDESWLRARYDQLHWMAAQLDGMHAGETRIAARVVSAGDGALELMVHTPDRRGLFAAVVATLDRLGLDVVHARLFDAPEAQVIDVFQLMPRDRSRCVDPRDIETRLHEVLAGALEEVRPARHAHPSHLRHFRIASQIAFSEEQGRTLLSVVTNDRPGLLAAVAQVLFQQQFPVHDARIATFGERAEDVFRISTLDNQPLTDDEQAALRDALLTILQGDHA